MPLSPAEQALLDDMKQREQQIKRKKRATDAILFRERRYRVILVTCAGILVAGIAAVLFFVVFDTALDRVGWWLPALVAVALSVGIGVQLGKRFLNTRLGRKLLAKYESRIRARYTGDLNAGQRWLQFFYRDEDISAYVPQILYFLEADQRFDSVDEALAFAKRNQQENAAVAAQALKEFEQIATSTNLAIISTATTSGRSSSRIMRFVTTDRAGVWFVTTAPDAPKVSDFERGSIAVVTVPTESGATISSNRVGITRADQSLADVADLYRDQVPGYLDGMTEVEQQRELVYELTFQSAKVDTWLDHELVEFGDPQRA